MKLYHEDHKGLSGGHDELHEHVHEHTHVHTHDGSAHEHSHTHSHEHNGGAAHEHSHDETELHLPDKEMKTLYALLDHWVEHNISHQEGFTEWAEKAARFGKAETAESIKKAVAYMQQANDMLTSAKKKME